MADMSKSISKKTAEELIKRAKANHIWVNAFTALNPTDENLIALGRTVLNKLKESDMRDERGISSMEIFTINMS